jgi:radical SAM family uncharacterized protein
MAVFRPVVVRGVARSARGVGGRKMPLIAGHKLLYRCNLECKMCPFWRREDEELLSLADEVRMMESLADAGVSFMGFEGGEPLLRPHLVEILRESHARFHTSLVTNGWLLGRRLDELRPYLEHLFVSLDGIGPMHDFLRGIPGSYDKAVEGISRAREQLPTSISSTLTKSNLNQAEALVELAERLGVQVTFQVAYDYATADPMSPLRASLKETLERLLELKRDGAPIMQSPEYFESILASWFEGRSWHCKPWLTINIDPQGRIVMPCYVIREYAGTKPVWEVDLREMWNSYDWTEWEKCNKCALSCYLEPSLFSWGNPSMVNERLLEPLTFYIRQALAGPRPA